jgi:phospholipid/cholesterol/gamma-HCH transport system substrate-binding protein
VEIKANHVLIGGFTLTVVLVAFLFVAMVWSDGTSRTATYTVIFDGDVSGLSLGSQVRYNGINVGEVGEIGFHPEDPSKVVVVINIDGKIPIKEDSYASLEAQLLTGVAIVSIAGGSIESAELRAKSGERHPVIKSRKSGLQQLFTGAPDLIAQANVLVAQLTRLVNEENQESIAEILSNIAEVTQTVSDKRGDIGELIENLSAVSGELSNASKNLESMSSNLNDLTKNANDLVENDAKVFMSEITQAARNIGNVADSIDVIVKDNEDAINDFSHQGLAQLGRFVTEARQLVATLDRVATKIESDPAAFIFGNQASEIEPQ